MLNVAPRVHWLRGPHGIGVAVNLAGWSGQWLYMPNAYVSLLDVAAAGTHNRQTCLAHAEKELADRGAPTDTNNLSTMLDELLGAGLIRERKIR